MMKCRKYAAEMIFIVSQHSYHGHENLFFHKVQKGEHTHTHIYIQYAQ